MFADGRRIRLLLPVLLALAVIQPIARGKNKSKLAPASSEMDEQKRAVHALNRLTYGPRPGDVERVRAIGVDKWIEQQLHPEKIDDSSLEARLSPFRTLRMSAKDTVESFPSAQLVKQVMDGKQPLPSDPVKRAVYQAQMDRIEQKQELKQVAASTNGSPVLTTADADPTNAAPAAVNPPAANPAKPKLTEEEIARRREDRFFADMKTQELLNLPPDQRMKEILKMTPEQQRAMANYLRNPKNQGILDGMSPQQKETLTALQNPQQVVTEELVEAKMLRAIYSERQLDEVMTDFWFNHFNVYSGKGVDRYFLPSYERDVIRPHALGKFEDLLVATAKSPAMLFYLDNWLSLGPNSDVALGIPKNVNRPGNAFRATNFPASANARKGKGKKTSGLNENYGRELMELHTLGVNGGYTQKDVTEVARVFTGWTIERPQDGGGFKFEERMHDPGDKMVMGHRIKNHGEKEGTEVLHLLAYHPSTAKFVSTKLAMRFVSDNPPPALINRMADTFLKKDGDIREVLRTMFRSPEFWSADSYRAKVKTPLEFVASAARATGADVSDALPLARQLNNMGMPLYGMQPPTGYSMKADTWVNSSALLGRMNFALALAGGKVRGVQVETDHLLSTMPQPADSLQTLTVLENSFLCGDVSKQTHDTIAKQLEDPQVAQRRLDDAPRPPNVPVIAGLILGSPEFQRR
jgi:uncharacterized protein (DUF1800 family)